MLRTCKISYIRFIKSEAIPFCGLFLVWHMCGYIIDHSKIMVHSFSIWLSLGRMLCVRCWHKIKSLVFWRILCIPMNYVTCDTKNSLCHTWHIMSPVFWRSQNGSHHMHAYVTQIIDITSFCYMITLWIFVMWLCHDLQSHICDIISWSIYYQSIFHQNR